MIMMMMIIMIMMIIRMMRRRMMMRIMMVLMTEIVLAILVITLRDSLRPEVHNNFVPSTLMAIKGKCYDDYDSQSRFSQSPKSRLR